MVKGNSVDRYARATPHTRSCRVLLLVNLQHVDRRLEVEVVSRIEFGDTAGLLGSRHLGDYSRLSVRRATARATCSGSNE